MIKINLLPKKPKKAVFKYDMYLFLLITVLNLALLGWLYFSNANQIVDQKGQIKAARQEIQSLDVVYREYLSIDKEKKEIERRIRAIDNLKVGRALAARTLYDLTSVTRESLWLKSFRKSAGRFELEGRSLENESISSFVESLSKIPYMKNVDLKSVQDVTEEGISMKKFIVQGNMGL
jgi:Tfp pilus assembly protein PilN